MWGSLFWVFNKDPTIQAFRLGSPIFGNSHLGLGVQWSVVRLGAARDRERERERERGRGRGRGREEAMNTDAEVDIITVTKCE